MTIFRKKILLIILICLSAIAAFFCAISFMRGDTVSASADTATTDSDEEVYGDFLAYGGSTYKFYANLHYYPYVNSYNELNAKVILKVYWWTDDFVNVTHVTITLTYPSGKQVKRRFGSGNTSEDPNASTNLNTLRSKRELVLFTNDEHFDEEGEYKVQASGSLVGGTAVGQYSSITFLVDKHAPLGTLSGVSNHGFTNTNVRFTWTDATATATLDGKSYTKNSLITSEGNHTIELKDPAKNISKYSFTIDKTPPQGTLTGVGDGGITNTDVIFRWTEDNITVTLNDDSDYAKGTTIYKEGHYSIVLTDRAQNTTKYTFTIDKSPPKVKGYEEFTNKKIVLTAEDTYGSPDHWEYRFNSGNIQLSDGDTLNVAENYAEQFNGTWEARVIDSAGNFTQWFKVNYYYRETFGNSDTVYNTYFIPAYYNVTLTQNYADYYGTYEFADFNSALSFAIQKEWDCRVYPSENGWNYFTPNSEIYRQVYTDKTELDTVIDKYARTHISERKIMGQGGSSLNNPTDDCGNTRADALTRQLTELPSLLRGYSEFRFMLMSSNSCFILPKSGVEGNKVQLKVQFISDGISLREGKPQTLEYGEKLNTVAREQGWYLVEESDNCGNIEKYLVFVDFEYPQLHAQVTFGNGNDELINFNETFITENTETMRYLTFDIKSLSDNIDDYVMLIIDGRGLSAVQYIWGDELPVLTYENGYYGTYTVTVYDRSLNLLEFVIYIAGEAPTLTYTSLTNDTSCTFTIQVNDSKNEIADVRLYKVFFDGSQECLNEDSVGTQVCADNLVYKMTVGGKYVFEFRDLYGRIVITKPIFYLKGLPTAMLRGVTDGGITKNDVRITFDATCTAELSVLKNGEWVETDLYALSEGATQNTVSITSGEETSAVYNVLLYVTADRNLFTEYTFEIDGIPPKVDVFTERDEQVEFDAVTTRNFYIAWSEAGYTAYYRKGNAFMDEVYSKGTIIKAAGTYTFTVLDTVRNELTFTVTLDNIVDYSLNGSSYMQLDDGSLITKGNFVFTLLEPWSLFEVDASNGLNVTNGQKLDTDGTYKIMAKDIYGNSMALTLIVDKLPPAPIITTESGRALSNGARINESFSVTCEEESANITYSSGGVFIAYDGSLLTNAGNYTFTLTDIVGNSTEVIIVIDKALAFRVNGAYVSDLEGNFMSNSWLSISLNEEMTDFYILSEDSIQYDADKRVTAPGNYEVYMRDTSGNEKTFLLIIDKTPPTIQLVGVSNGIAVDGAVTVTFTDYAEAYYRRNGGDKVAVINGAVLVNEGSYVVTALDMVGNAATETFAIDKSVDVTSSIELADGQLITGTISFNFGEEVTALLCKDGKESVYAHGVISGNGEYSMTVTDNYRNVKTFNWTIVSKRSKEYSLAVGDYRVEIERDGEFCSAEIEDDVLHLTENGKYLLVFRQGSERWSLNIEVDNVAPTVELKNSGKTVTISNPNKNDVTYELFRDGQKVSFNFFSSAEITQKGSYRLLCTDDVGNTTEYVFEIDYMSNSTILLIAVVVTIVVAIIVALIIVRFRRRKY